MTPRTFPGPWRVEPNEGGNFDANDIPLAYARSDPALQDKYLTPAEALTIAEAIAKVPSMIFRKVADGLRMMKIHQRTLRDVEKAYGVDRFILAAVWGIESDYGQEMGEFFLPHSLSQTLLALGARPGSSKRS